MTASLANSSNGPLGFNVDGYVYPQFLGGQLRAPTTQDIYPEGTRWQNDAVNPAVQYYTTGAGIWNELPNSSFGVSSVTGTANQISASPTTGAVVLSLIGPYTPATYTAHGVLLGEGTSSIVATAVGSTGQGFMGSTGADPGWTGSPSFTGSVTAGTTLTATSGAITATNGNFVSSTAAKGFQAVVTATSGAASGTVNCNGRVGAVTFTSPSIAAGADLLLTVGNTSITGSGTHVLYGLTGVTSGAALSIKSVVNSASSSAVTITNGTGATTATADITLTFLVLD